MNQILITEKIYVTPELRRKKKLYKIMFILSIFTVVCLSSKYIYSEYERYKEEMVSKDILFSMANEEDDTIVGDYENALIVMITQDVTEEDIEDAENNTLEKATATSTFTDSKGNNYDSIGTVRIPKINVEYPILSKTSVAWLKVSTCKFHGANPNEVGNLCVVGHNYRNSKFFSKVPTLKIGDIVQITDLSNKTVDYEIYDMHTVFPDDTSDTTQKTNGRREVTLITCTDDSSQRVIVKCKEKV